MVRSTAFRLGLMLAAAPAVGCASAEPTSIEGRDRNAFSPRLRLVLEEPADPHAPSLVPNAKVLPLLGLEMDLAFAQGEDSQNLSSSQRIDYSGGIFPGPGTVEIDYVRYLASFSGRFGIRIEDRVRLEGLAGLGMEHVAVTLDSGTIRERDSTTSGGIHFGARVAWDPAWWGSLYTQVTGYDGFGSGRTVDTPIYELGVVGRPVPGLGILAGWRRWDYIEERSDSDLRLNIQGFFLGLELGF